MVSCSLTPNKKAAIRRVVANAATKPINVPPKPSRRLPETISRRISALAAPNATRIAISRRRCSTEYHHHAEDADRCKTGRRCEARHEHCGEIRLCRRTRQLVVHRPHPRHRNAAACLPQLFLDCRRDWPRRGCGADHPRDRHHVEMQRGQPVRQLCKRNVHLVGMGGRFSLTSRTSATTPMISRGASSNSGPRPLPIARCSWRGLPPPETLRHRLIDEDDRRGRLTVRISEAPAANSSNPERVEETG